jgi:hypothetical protein
LKAEKKPPPMPSLPAWSPPPPPATVPGMPPPPTMRPFPRSTFLWPTTTRKYSGRLRLQYEWVAGQWSLLRVENLSFKPE